MIGVARGRGEHVGVPLLEETGHVTADLGSRGCRADEALDSWWRV